MFPFGLHTVVSTIRALHWLMLWEARQYILTAKQSNKLNTQNEHILGAILHFKAKLQDTRTFFSKSPQAFSASVHDGDVLARLRLRPLFPLILASVGVGVALGASGSLVWGSQACPNAGMSFGNNGLLLEGRNSSGGGSDGSSTWNEYCLQRAYVQLHVQRVCEHTHLVYCKTVCLYLPHRFFLFSSQVPNSNDS